MPQVQFPPAPGQTHIVSAYAQRVTPAPPEDGQVSPSVGWSVGHVLQFQQIEP